MPSHPETTGDPHAVQARLESPRTRYATPRLRPGRLAPLDGGSSRRSTVMRLCPAGQPAHIRVIRRRSRRIAYGPGRLRSRFHRHPRRPLRHSDGRAAGAAGGPEHRRGLALTLCP